MDLAFWLGLGTALLLAGPLLWYNFRDFFREVDNGSYGSTEDAGDEGYVEERVNRLGDRVRLFWQLAVPVLVFVMVFFLCVAAVRSWLS